VLSACPVLPGWLVPVLRQPLQGLQLLLCQPLSISENTQPRYVYSWAFSHCRVGLHFCINYIAWCGIKFFFSISYADAMKWWWALNVALVRPSARPPVHSLVFNLEFNGSLQQCLREGGNSLFKSFGPYVKASGRGIRQILWQALVSSLLHNTMNPPNWIFLQNSLENLGLKTKIFYLLWMENE